MEVLRVATPAPLSVLCTGTAGGFRRLRGGGGAERRTGCALSNDSCLGGADGG